MMQMRSSREEVRRGSGASCARVKAVTGGYVQAAKSGITTNGARTGAGMGACGERMEGVLASGAGRRLARARTGDECALGANYRSEAQGREQEYRSKP